MFHRMTMSYPQPSRAEAAHQHTAQRLRSVAVMKDITLSAAWGMPAPASASGKGSGTAKARGKGRGTQPRAKRAATPPVGARPPPPEKSEQTVPSPPSQKAEESENQAPSGGAPEGGVQQAPVPLAACAGDGPSSSAPSPITISSEPPTPAAMYYPMMPPTPVASTWPLGTDSAPPPAPDFQMLAPPAPPSSTSTEECNGGSPPDDAIEKEATKLLAATGDTNKFNELVKRLGAPTEANKEGDEQDKMLQDLRIASQKGFESRSALGQRFGRSSEGRSSEYKALSSQEKKRQFRQAWAEKELQKAVTIYEKKTSQTELDISRGVYLPPGKIVEEEGGRHDPENIVAAWKLIRKCLALGGKFVRYNAFTERYEFLYFRAEVHHIFEEAPIGAHTSCLRPSGGGAAYVYIYISTYLICLHGCMYT